MARIVSPRKSMSCLFLLSIALSIFQGKVASAFVPACRTLILPSSGDHHAGNSKDKLLRSILAWSSCGFGCTRSCPNSFLISSYMSCSDKETFFINEAPIDRRKCIASVVAATAIGATAAFADESAQPSTSPTLFKGVATLKQGTEFKTLEPPTAALYVTARPESMSNAPKELFDAMGGRSPPVLTARFPIGEDAFPFSFQLVSADVTAEGAFGSTPGGMAETHQEMSDQVTSYWWSKDNLIISARLDSDGVAATRDPEDLVGRSIALISKDAKQGGSFIYKDGLVVELQGRGIGGKFVTRKQTK